MTQAPILPDSGDSPAEALAYFTAAMQALATLSAGGSVPPEFFANMPWLDTSVRHLKLRNAGNTDWENLVAALAPNGAGYLPGVPVEFSSAVAATAYTAPAGLRALLIEIWGAGGGA
ncbi:hypothetical protein, partial [Mangrovicoccus sp. HB161399]|uniref:hypothetical protein n=1 Tax=Mangrovicoccus sp. HB161399 TaxID=2720392 RepID=UPI0015551445